MSTTRRQRSSTTTASRRSGTIDVDLPRFGAKVRHKDLFLELDYTIGRTPRRDDIQAMKQAMAAAPLPNPDNKNGVKLWVDTGALVDPNAREDGALGTCADGIDRADTDCANAAGNRQYLETSVEDLPANCGDGADNDADGRVDGLDPECLAGDDLGGGNAIPALNNCGVDAAFKAAKARQPRPTRASPTRGRTPSATGSSPHRPPRAASAGMLRTGTSSCTTATAARSSTSSATRWACGTAETRTTTASPTT
jgi:hypothetical protein